MDSEERRAPGASRMPFEALVEVGGALGPSFEAQAVNVSEEGMHLRTAYLPEEGQPLTCRFDTASGQSVLASGEVVWTQAAERGGEFGIRFTDMDPESIEALKRICAASASGSPAQPGSKVRLHIDGLASPMRAKIKDAQTTAVTVGSDLGFLQVGKQLDLEDADSGARRPASIDRVEVQVDPASQVPQLVVTLRYADVQADIDAARGEAAPVEAPPPAAPAMAADDAAMEQASEQMKGAVARGIAKIGPAMERFASRAKTTIALFAKRRREKTEENAPRRMTAPPPGGGLHATGRRVVRGDSTAATHEEGTMIPKTKMTKRKAMVAGAVMMAAVAGAIIIKKSHHDAAADPNATPATADTAATTPAEPAGPTTPAPTALAAAPPPVEVAPGAPPSFGPVAANDDGADAKDKAHKKHGKVTPFGNGAVRHGNVLHLKMDGPIDSIEGAQQPTGFAVKLPGRRSLEAAGPLASRDGRIAAIKVANDPAGAELTLAFKDGVPNYQVSAKGDTLIIALAPAGPLDKGAMAKKDEKGGKAPKHAPAKHEPKKKSEKH